MRRRFSGRKAKWAYAHAQQLLVGDNSLGSTYVAGWLVPPGRVRWLCDDWKQAHVTHVATHMWLDFRWQSSPGAGAGYRAIPDVQFYAIKSDADPNTNLPIETQKVPWSVPTFPSAITDWEENTDDDGTDAFMWCHRMKGMTPPNAIVANVGNVTEGGQTIAWNQTDRMASFPSDTATAYLCRTFSVRAEWQPDVIIRAKRRLEKDSGVAIVMSVHGDTNVDCLLEVYSRTLLK